MLRHYYLPKSNAKASMQHSLQKLYVFKCSLMPLTLLVWWLCASASFETAEATQSDTAAVIVCSSRFWHNYRHAANALSIYSETRRHLQLLQATKPFLTSWAASD